MLKTEEYSPKPERRIRVIELTCDDCGVKAEHPRSTPSYAKWKNDYFNGKFIECSVVITEGVKFTGIGSGNKTEYIYDICPDCLRKRMDGLSPREIETDW